MRDQTDSRTIPLSLGKPARQRTGQSGAGFLPSLKAHEQQELEFQQDRIAGRERDRLKAAADVAIERQAAEVYARCTGFSVEEAFEILGPVVPGSLNA